MKIETYIKEIQDFIAQNKLEEAIQLFIDGAREHRWEVLKDVLGFSRDNQSLNQAIIRGRLKWEDGEVRKREIAFSILNLIEWIEKDTDVHSKNY